MTFGNDFAFIDQAADRFTDFRGQFGSIIVHIETFQLVSPIRHRKGIGSGFMLSAGNRTGKTSLYLCKFIALNNSSRGVFELEQNLFYLRLCLPPIRIGGKPHAFTGMEFRNDIGSGSGRIITRHTIRGNYGKCHLKEQTVIGT